MVILNHLNGLIQKIDCETYQNNPETAYLKAWECCKPFVKAKTSSFKHNPKSKRKRERTTT